MLPRRCTGWCDLLLLQLRQLVRGDDVWGYLRSLSAAYGIGEDVGFKMEHGSLLRCSRDVVVGLGDVECGRRGAILIDPSPWK